MSQQPPSDRKCFKIGDGLYRMDQEIEVCGVEKGYDGTGPYWVVGHVQILSGSLSFLVDAGEVQAPSDSILMVMPQNSIVEVKADNIETINRAAFSRQVQIQGLPNEPIVFAVPKETTLRSKEEVELALAQVNSPLRISRNTNPHVMSLKIKDYLGVNFDKDLSLPELAEEARMTGEALSRVFKKDWGKSPIQYRNWLRVMDSFRLISEKSAIIDTAYDVGFNDLSRFHKQFKSTVGYTPLSIRTRSKNAKI